MRVITGILRGRVIEAPAGYNTRPMTDRVKESLFNMLGSWFGTPGGLPELDVLDLFAGSGALGIESLSRGARSCLFVERDREALRALRANVAAMQLRDAAKITAENVWSMRFIPHSPAGYGLIFTDPPYREMESPQRVVDLLERVGVALAADGVLVLRHEWKNRFPAEELRCLRPADTREYGRMRIWLLTRADRPETNAVLDMISKDTP